MPRTQASVGQMLQSWRKARHKSQLGLATDAAVSARHVCFIETGRARPSREMVLHLATVLDVPLRERNALLLAAGFAPIYAETALAAPELKPIRTALDAILRQQQPHPALVMDRHWDLVQTNAAAARLFEILLDGSGPLGAPNVLRLMFHPKGVRRHVTNWESVAESLVHRAHREAIGGVPDAALEALLDEILGYPGVPARWGQPPVERPLVPVIPVSFAKGHRTWSYFSTVMMFGTPQDITAQELRVECFFPADEATSAATR